MALSTVNSNELTPSQVQKLLVSPLERASTFLAAAPTIFSVADAGPVRVPKLTSKIDPAWTPENTQIPLSEPGIGEVVLLDGTPKIAVITLLSVELVNSAILDIVTAVAQRAVLDTAAKIDSALWAGDGVNSTPKGIVNYTGTQTMTGVGSPTIDKLYDALAAAMVQNVDPTKLRWAMTSRDFIALRKLKTTTGEYLVSPDVTAALGYTLLGVPISVTNAIPIGAATPFASTIVLADFSTIAVARVNAPTVTVLTERYADFHQVGVKVIVKYDAAPLLPEAIVLMKGVT